jgi:hypothetical protein
MRLKDFLKDQKIPDDGHIELNINGKEIVNVYPKSIHRYQELVFFIARKEIEKFLFIISKSSTNDIFNNFKGRLIQPDDLKNDFFAKQCPLNHVNALKIQEIFEFTRPKVIGLQNSFGFGDRLGLANPGHLRSLSGSSFKPILAQQSIRELTRTNRTPQEVMDAAVWATIQEGYKKGFGADADHLKTTSDIDLMVNAGFTMFTIDPSDHVDNQADQLDEKTLSIRTAKLPWQKLDDSLINLLDRYQNMKVRFTPEFGLEPTRAEILRSLTKYGEAIVHIKMMYDYLVEKYPEYPFEVECSVDETESVTTPFEHFFFANELRRLKVNFVSLAPRFIGEFEKGIDYKGDLTIFRTEYQKHLQIASYFGTYKLSLHSGSDKFQAYDVIGSFNLGYTHVKTAGTSYLEALKAVAMKSPELFRKIYDFSRDIFNHEKKTYHVSANINKLKPAREYKDDELLSLFSKNDARQVLHVAFGAVLTEKNEQGFYLFRDKILHCLMENEEIYYQLLVLHFKKHLDPFKH